jgi:hypothetical protein
MDTHQIYFVAAVLNSVCCAYPLKGILKLRGQPKSSYHYFEVIRFSFFCMSFWFAYGVQSLDSLPFFANLVGFSISASCLIAYGFVFREIRRVCRNLAVGVCIVLVFRNLHLDYLIPLGCLVTVRLYFYCLIDLTALKNNKSCKSIDIFDNCVNCLNTIAWTVYGISDQDVFIVAAFFFGFAMYAQIFSYAIFYEYLIPKSLESIEDEKSHSKNTQV